MSINILFIMLYPPVLLARDFLPEWFVWSSGLYLLLLTVFRMPKIIGYLLPIFIYFIFKTVGTQIIPETTIPTLAILLLSQFSIDRSKGEFSSYLAFLWFGIFSLFSVNLYFILYSTITFVLFFLSENRIAGDSLIKSIKTVFKYKKQLATTFILSSFLFIFFPRFNSFLPSANNQSKGKVGYGLSIDNTTTSDLALSSNTAFYAELSKNIPSEQLYWRGRVHSYTDGYNWRATPAPASSSGKEDGTQDVVTSTIKYEQNFSKDIIILDRPIEILNSNSRIYSINSTNEKKLYADNKKIIFTATSTLTRPKGQKKLTASEKKTYLQLPVFSPNDLKELNLEFEKLTSAESIISEFSKYILAADYGYTLSPGPMPTMKSFLEKKVGYCTHFASLLGIILRMNNIPARLVSGFQGGIYNQVGDYYEIKSNDAHAWVEYFSKGNWNRIDPTAFVSPERIQFGGERFLTTSSQEREELLSGQFPILYQVKQYVDNLDYKVSLFFDNYNKDQQKNFSAKLGLSLRSFLIVGGILIGLTLGSLYYFLSKRKKIIHHPVDVYLIALDKKLKNKEHKLINKKTIEEMRNFIRDTNHNDLFKQQAYDILNEYQKLRYSIAIDETKIQSLLKNLKN